MEIFSYQRSFPTGCFRLKGKIRLIVTVMLGKVTAIEESRVVWFILIVPEIVNGLFGKRFVTLMDELFVFWFTSAYQFAFGYKLF